MSDENTDDESSSDSPFDELDDDEGASDDDPFDELDDDSGFDALDVDESELDPDDVVDEAELDTDADVDEFDAGELDSGVHDSTLETDLATGHGGDPLADRDDGKADDDVDPEETSDADAADLGDDLLDDGPDPPEDVFVEMDVDEIDEDSVWQDLISEDDVGDGAVDGRTDSDGRTGASTRAEAEAESTSTGGTVPGATEGDFGDEIVSKQRFCEGCEYFSPPPNVACTNPGTEIVELVDNEHYRVSDCPVVAERRDENGRLFSDHL